MLPIRDFALRRIEPFLLAMRERIYGARVPVQLSVFPAHGRIPFQEAMQGSYRPAAVGEQFGERWATYWFRLDYTVPPEWGNEEVHLCWDSASEACVFSTEGIPLQALTGTARHWDGRIFAVRNAYRLTDKTGPLYIEMAANGLFGIEDPKPIPTLPLGLLRQAELAVFNSQAWEFLWDVTTIGEIARSLPADDPRAGQALAAIHEIINRCDPDVPETWSAATPFIEAFMGQESAHPHHIYAMGHAHLDTAWLWPLAETQRKAYRTLATTLRLIEDYPEYRFAFSQAQQYAWLKEQHPALYADIKRAVADGRIVPVGGTWIEPDCNIPSGESLVRQFVVGQRFFEAEFGIRCEEFWLPDTFGYAAALPTIMQGAGIRYFLTQKLSWNQFNRPRRSTFYWEGLDGSRVLAHFPPADTYNAVATIEEILFSVKNFKDHDRSRYSMYLFGFGDGGAGPTPEMLERLRRVRNVAGMPRVEIQPPLTFFNAIEKEMQALTPAATRYSTVRGELYFEMHRGTYTTQSRTKRNNRLSERLLHDVEYLAALAHITGKASYPREAIDRLWRVVLLNQFHDILPGSSIGEVYADADRAYAEVLAEGEQLRTDALRALYGEQADTIAVNTLAVDRYEVIEVKTSDGRTALREVAVPASGSATPVNASSSEAVLVLEDEQTVTLQNAHLRASFRRDGRLISLQAASTSQELIDLAAGGGNQFVVYLDRPVMWDAWDVDLTALESRGEPLTANSIEIVQSDPLRASIRFVYTFGKSRITQTVQLDNNATALVFDHEVDWHETHRWLRVETATTIRAEEAIYETQFGVVKRPTHYNTSYDVARFEVCAQRWADLYQPGLGLALLNDCKYGYSVYGGTIGLSLLRAPTSPDPHADQGKHRFRFALLPHTAPYWEADLVTEGLRFNTPLLLTQGAAVTESFFRFSNAYVVLDTVKLAEDGDGLILRLYEPYGARVETFLHTSLPLAEVRLCNLLEDDLGAASWDGQQISLTLEPFQILTLRLRLNG